ncbi:ASCH domain-containing protein [Marinibaculum pumilum]|uniref:ASCH domain-containing protein n=1 Tax=Marinibaculum pumilum TaxID=1766165 RepID=A0ABV7L353_9PROT
MTAPDRAQGRNPISADSCGSEGAERQSAGDGIPGRPVEKCLSIRQPYAFAIVNGWKPVENRSWWTPFRGPVWIHAGKREERDDVLGVLSDILHQGGDNRPGAGDPLLARYQSEKALGCIVGRAVITDCVQGHPSPWFYGPYGFVLTNARPCRPVPCRGALGFFSVPPEVMAQLPPR